MTTSEGILLHLPGPERLVEPTDEAAAPAQSITTLVAEYSPLLFRVAHSILRSRPDAEDVVQETFLRVLQHRATLPTLRDPRVWLTRIAWNLALDRRRRIRPTQMDDLFAASLVARTLPADAALASHHALTLVLAEIERLPEKERHVLLLSTQQDLDAPAIAAILNRSESAVRALLHRARTRLRERLEQAQKKQSRPTKGRP